VSDRWSNGEQEQAMRLVLKELTHRVDGEFTSAIRTLSTAAALARSEEARNALSAVQCRLQNFARVHNALRVPEHRTRINGYLYLRQLCTAITQSRLQHRGMELELLERPFQIDSEQCWRLGLMVSELVSCAARHSFVSIPGRIWVAAARRKALIWCRVDDNGVAKDDEAERCGLRIVEALVRELHGEFEQEHGQEGHVATLVFPAVCV
jgi:two-component sensor histidine kinase